MSHHMKWEKTAFKGAVARARGLGSAKEGAEHWIAQRLTALANIPLVLWMILSLAHLRAASHAEAVDYLSQPVNAIAALLLVLSVTHHAKLGLQIVVEDYIHCEASKTALMWGLQLFAALLMVAGVFSILSVAL
jgi:succinate dehydrogenase / fumarate reductase membrane anchor subunit